MPYIGGNSSLVICLRELVFCESFNVLWRMSLRGIEFLRKLPWRHRVFFSLVSPLISVNKFDKKYWNRSVNALKNPTLSCLVLGVDLFLIFTFIRCESLVVCTTGVLVISLLTGEWFCFSDTKRTSHVVVFFCKHVYHEDCLPARDVVSNDQVKISKAVFGTAFVTNHRPSDMRRRPHHSKWSVQSGLSHPSLCRFGWYHV